jgi:hypothetical protein
LKLKKLNTFSIISFFIIITLVFCKTISAGNPIGETADSNNILSNELSTMDNKMNIPALESTAHTDKTSSSIWKSRKFKTQIKGLSIGDVDGDRRNETVFINGKKIFIYRHSADSFEKIREIQGKSYDNFISVDVADINNNGKSEIFVTNLSGNKRLRSFVLEWNGTQFEKIIYNANRYYRVLNESSHGHNILLGQKRGVDSIFFNGIYELKWNKDKYAPADRQIVPKWMNVYSFNYGDVLNNGQEMIIAFTHNDHLLIIDKNGNEEWTSSERYGGSVTYFEDFSESGSNKNRRTDDPKAMKYIYLPQRLHIVDLDKDGKKEVVVVRNIDAAGRLFSRLRMFKSGHIECLIWDNFGLYQKWKTREISGHISDYVIGDIDNDGQDELVFSVVAKTGSVFGKARSFIVSQDIN